MENINHSLRDYQNVRPGTAILNPLSGEIGTIGLIATSDDMDRWIVGCCHVFGPRDGTAWPLGTFAPLYYPADTLRSDPIAIVDEKRLFAELDCAAALVPAHRRCFGYPLGLGPLAAPVDAVPGQMVLKSGGVTGVTEGYVRAVRDAEIEIASLGLSPGYRMNEPGDSGALWVDAATRAPVGLHRGGDAQKPQLAYAVPIRTVLDKLALRIVHD